VSRSSFEAADIQQVEAMSYHAPDSLAGGMTSYGCVAGILSLHSTAPRLPGDPVNARTFDFPVCHAVVEDVTIRDLIALDSRNIDKIIAVARSLEKRGVRFIATSCGLFGPFQKAIAAQLRVPFLSTALQVVPFLSGLLGAQPNICLMTAHSGILQEGHVRDCGFGLQDVTVKGMEQYPEFARIVLQGELNQDAQKLRREVRAAAEDIKAGSRRVDLVVLECPNLITFRSEIQQVLGVPVFDIVNLINFFAAACRLQTFSDNYI
jgi:Asp/Glu/hydantoin racemase